jgi:hypothetical protein
VEYRKPAGARICRESPLGRNRRSVRRRTRPDRRVAVRPQTIAIRKNRQGACRLARTPLSVQRRCGVRHRPNPADAPQRSSPARAAHKGQGDHDPKPVHWLGETRHRLLDQEERGHRVRGADQLVWASLERGDTDQRDGAGAKKEGLPPRPSASPWIFIER